MTEQRYVAHGLVEADGRILLLQRREGRYLGGFWDIPGGTVEPGETPAEAAVRECVEEADLRCELGPELTHFENLDTGGRPITFHTLTYRLHPGPDPVVAISHEHQDFRWVTRAEAGELPVVWHVERTLAALD
jgi:8-oxo-dGTP diphosphatase